MTAAELIQRLRQFPPETDVQIRDGEDDFYQEPIYTDIASVEFHRADFQNSAAIRLEGV